MVKEIKLNNITDKLAYQAVNDYLSGLSNLKDDKEALLVHLRAQSSSLAFGENGPSLKAVTVIRSMLEDDCHMTSDEIDLALKKLDEEL